MTSVGMDAGAAAGDPCRPAGHARQGSGLQGPVGQGTRRRTVGDIGTERREVEFEPLPEPVVVPVPAEPEPERTPA